MDSRFVAAIAALVYSDKGADRRMATQMNNHSGPSRHMLAKLEQKFEQQGKPAQFLMLVGEFSCSLEFTIYSKRP